MATAEKIKDVFDYFDVKSGVDSEYGDWVVSKDADVINVEKGYPIYTHQIESSSIDYWLDHMREKSWFNDTEDVYFQQAFNRAKELL